MIGFSRLHDFNERQIEKRIDVLSERINLLRNVADLHGAAIKSISGYESPKTDDQVVQ